MHMTMLSNSLLLLKLLINRFTLMTACLVQTLFSEGGFLLRKWNSSEPVVLEHLPPELIDTQSTHSFSDPEVYTKTLGIQWNSSIDSFRLSDVEPPSLLSHQTSPCV